MYQIYILDDEIKAIETLEFLIQHVISLPFSIRKQTDPVQAIIEINQNKPDLLFLDIQMPVKNGFEVIKAIDQPDFPIIFTTAYDQYAIDAIKVSALDYLLKPVDIEELKGALEKFQNNTNQNNLLKKYEILSQNQLKQNPNKLTLHEFNGLRIIDIDQIIRLQADSNYTDIHLESGKVYTNTKTLKEFEDMLSTSGFMRVHKSHLINVEKITAYLKNEYLVLADKSEVPVARRKRKELKELLR